MARLEAQSTALYYPTELRVIAGIARLLEFRWPADNTGPIRVIDPAAGTGRAVATLAKILTQFMPQPAVELYGIELDANRADQCQPYMTAVLNTDTKTAKVTDRSFDLLFCNPPYDFDTLGQDKRLEHAFLIRCTKMVRPGGYIVWVLPRYVLEVSADWLAAFYKDHIVRRFPKPESERFDQIVIVAQRKAAKLPNPKRAEELAAMSKSESEIKLLACPDLSEFNQLLKELHAQGIQGPEITDEIGRLASYRDEIETAGVAPKNKAVIMPGPKAKDKINFAYGEYHPGEAMLEADKAGIWSNSAKRDLLYVPPSQAMVIRSPLMPMRIGMSSQFIQIGLGNNLLLRNEQRKIVIKGKTVKRWKNVAVELDDEGQQKKRIDREVISSEIKVLDLDSGEVETLDPDGLGTLVQEFSGSIHQQMLQNYPPLYVPMPPAKRQVATRAALEAIAKDSTLAGPHHKNKRRKARKEARLIGELEQGLARIKVERKPLGGQKIAIPAAALSLKKYGYATMECEMGTGKTTMGVAAAWLAGARRPIVTCPSTLLEKWVREVKATVPGADALIVASITDLEKARKRILEHEAFVERMYRPDLAKGEHYPPFFTIMSKEQMKMESGWQAAVVYHPPRGESIEQNKTAKIGHQKITKSFWAKEVEGGPYYPKDKEGRLVRDKETGKLLMWPHCPHCDSPIYDRNGLPVNLAKLEKRINCTTCGEPLWQRKSKLMGGGKRWDWETESRGSVLDPMAQDSFRRFRRSEGENDDGWQTLPQYRDTYPGGYRKVKLSQYIQKRMNRFFDLCIIDEVHQMKAKGSAQGVSAGRLAMACKWTLTLTGTFADGYSSMVMHLLWRFTDPKLRKEWGRHETGRWAKKYGIIKATRIGRGGAPDENNEDIVVADGANSDREIGGRIRFEEAPGISPEVALLTIPHTVYLSLVDVTKDLPPYREYPTAGILLRKESDGVYGQECGELAGKPLPSQYEAYHNLANKLTAELKQQLAKGSTRLLGAMVHALLAWVDNPTREEIVRDPKTKLTVATAPALPATVLYPKEQKLVKLYRRTKAAGKKLMIYIAYTDARDMAPRLKWVLQQADPHVKVAVMSGGDAKKREAWIEKQVQQGCDVLITHPKKVEVGLDLLKFPVIVFYNIYYVTQTIEQAKKRAWRIGQTQPCETHFWAYGGTAQEKGLRHVARKIYAAMKLKGQIVDEGIAELLGDDEEESMLKAIAHAITRDEPEGGEEGFSLESLMSHTLDQEIAEAAFILSDQAASDLEVEEAITTLYEKTHSEQDELNPEQVNDVSSTRKIRLLTAAELAEEVPRMTSATAGVSTFPTDTSANILQKVNPQVEDKPRPAAEVSELLAVRPDLEEFRAKLLAVRSKSKKSNGSKKDSKNSPGQLSLFD